MAEDIRLTVPLYRVAEAARYVRVPESTYSAWAKGYVRRLDHGKRVVEGQPVITCLPARKGQPSVPFIGLAESMVLAAFRRAGVSLQHIRQAIPAVEREVGLEHALASERLYTDGAVILYDYAQSARIGEEAAEELAGLTRVVDGQRVFSQVVKDYLRRITYGADGLATEIVLPYTERDVLRVNPLQAGGRPLFVRGRTRLEDVVSRWRAGERMTEIAADFEIPLEDVEDAVRLAVAA